MRSRALWGCCVMGCLASVAVWAFAQDRAMTTAKTEEDRIVPVDPATVEADEAPGPIRYVPLEAGTVFERHVVLADDADVTAVVSEQFVYSNTLGTFMTALGAGNLVADDITTTVRGGCKLTRYEFPVVGKVETAGDGGPYTVDFALYRSCPSSVPVASRPGLIIPGTQGRSIFPDDAPRLISFVAGSNVFLQTNMWLGVKFSRNNAGVITGTPPLQGFSCDQFDFPGFPCSNTLGGFPDSPQGSFNLQIYADSACSASFTGYKNDMPAGPPYSPGQNIVFADDIQLVNGGCNLIGYEVAVQGVGFYTFDMRRTCNGPAIPGTERTFNGSGTDVKIARLIVDPPVALPQNLWFSAKIGSVQGKVVIAGQQACIGATEDLIIRDEACNIVPAGDLGIGMHGAFSLTITCAGPAPVGACCDMFVTQCRGGPNAEAACVGRCSNTTTTRCQQNSDCPAGETCPMNIDCNYCSGGTQDGKPCDPLIPAAQNPCNQGGGNCPVQGTCESVCRDVPQTNCPFPPRINPSLQPGWVQGAACQPDPFGTFSCGRSACCYADQQNDQCTNLTLTACNQAGDLALPRQWQMGRYCNDGGQLCPKIACLARRGECTLPRCQQASVCSGGANDGQPCSVNADCRVCVGGTNPGTRCTSNTECLGGGSCPGVCVGGTNPGTRCTSNAECLGGGSCRGTCKLCGGDIGMTCHVSPTCCDSCPPVGCEDAFCCTKVCNYGESGAYCCSTEWDDVCASMAADPQLNLCSIIPANDVCIPNERLHVEGARLLTLINGFVTAETDSGRATEEAGDPGFGCYKNDPGAQGLQTVWYKFVATETSALFQTCHSNSPADDSLLEVFAVGDMSEPLTQCRSLIPIGCNDDFPGCSSSNTNSKICIGALVPGNLYYVLVAAKTAESRGIKYRLEISTPCTTPVDPVPNDDCPGAITITDGTTHFGPNDLPKATLTAPAQSCISGETRDVWYRYKATCTGTLTVETCDANNPPASPDTNLAVYDQGPCPYNPVSPAPLACSTNALDCSPGSKLQIDVVKDIFYTIRLANEAGNAPEGDLKVACVTANCPAGEMTITNPPNGVVDAGRPSDPSNAALLQGIKIITATAPYAAHLDCFALCDTAFPVPANSIVSAVEDPGSPGTYTITLARPITAGALTTLTYTDIHGAKSSGRLTSHPANVDADAFASEADVQRLVDILNGTFTPPWGVYSDDIDRSVNVTPPVTTGVTPADILEVVDLLNGAGAYDPWDGTPNPSTSTACPPP